jgi:hypothetical protein
MFFTTHLFIIVGHGCNLVVFPEVPSDAHVAGIHPKEAAPLIVIPRQLRVLRIGNLIPEQVDVGRRTAGLLPAPKAGRVFPNCVEVFPPAMVRVAAAVASQEADVVAGGGLCGEGSLARYKTRAICGSSSSSSKVIMLASLVI